ncbi:hypothetical protein ACNO8X_17615 [Mycobacterium sp. PDNC021]|uniref:hypothetical protein n=1 Tax=Mycobacterium sp. PDNC021 TaxID=3391399 RepID=UPI003AAF5AD6
MAARSGVVLPDSRGAEPAIERAEKLLFGRSNHPNSGSEPPARHRRCTNPIRLGTDTPDTP